MLAEFLLFITVLKRWVKVAGSPWFFQTVTGSNPKSVNRYLECEGLGTNYF